MRIGIIGSGFGLYGLLPAFNSLKGCEVVAICGRKTERLSKYCNHIGLDKIYTDWESMLKDERLDSIAIAVAPSAQFEIANAAMKKGIHVFAEKPLTATLAQAKKLLSLATKKKVITAVDFIFPEIAEWKKAKELVDRKTYGELKSIVVKWDFQSYSIKNKIYSWKTDVSEGGGALSFFSSHSLYYIEHFAGEIKKMESRLTYPTKGDFHKSDIAVDLVLLFKNGATGQVHVCCDVPNTNRHQVVLECEKATLILGSVKGITDSFSLKVVSKGKTKRIVVKKEKTKYKEEDERVVVVKRIAEKFIKACRTRKPMSPSFKEGARVQKLIEDIRIANPAKRR